MSLGSVSHVALPAFTVSLPSSSSVTTSNRNTLSGTGGYSDKIRIQTDSFNFWALFQKFNKNLQKNVKRSEFVNFFVKFLYDSWIKISFCRKRKDSSWSEYLPLLSGTSAVLAAFGLSLIPTLAVSLPFLVRNRRFGRQLDNLDNSTQLSGKIVRFLQTLT